MVYTLPEWHHQVVDLVVDVPTVVCRCCCEMNHALPTTSAVARATSAMDNPCALPGKQQRNHADDAGVDAGTVYVLDDDRTLVVRHAAVAAAVDGVAADRVDACRTVVEVAGVEPSNTLDAAAAAAGVRVDGLDDTDGGDDGCDAAAATDAAVV